jgi:hypothetical protein
MEMKRIAIALGILAATTAFVPTAETFRRTTSNMMHTIQKGKVR